MHFETRTKVNRRSYATRERTESVLLSLVVLDSDRLIAIDGRIKRRTMRLAALKLDWKPPSSLTFYSDTVSSARFLATFVTLILIRIEWY